MKYIHRFTSVLTLAAVAAAMFFTLPFDVKYQTAVSAATAHFVVVDLTSPPQDPAVAAVLASMPAPMFSRIAMLGESNRSLASYNTEIAGALHAAGLATHSQPRAQAKV